MTTEEVEPCSEPRTLVDRFTTVTLAGTGVTVTAEKTACPHLVIAPGITRDGLTGQLALVHVGTGRSLPPPLMGDKADLHAITEKVADLPWDFTDVDAITADDEPAKQLREQLRDEYYAARRAVKFADGERILQAYPDGWQDDPQRIPGTADAMVKWLLDAYQATDDRIMGDGPGKIPLDLPDGTPNPAWTNAVMRKVDLFGMAYLLAALRRVVPEVADHATAFLAAQWDGGDSLGEWVWEWRQQVEKGEPLRLPAVPSPEPADGMLFGSTA